MNETKMSNEINELKEYLRFISILYNKILTTSATGEKKATKILTKEQKNFNENYRKSDNSAKFYKEHRKNFKKLSTTKPYDKYPIEIYLHTAYGLVDEIKENQYFSRENIENINKLINTIFRQEPVNINNILEDLIQEYNLKSKKIELLEQRLENLKKPNKSETITKPETIEHKGSVNDPASTDYEPTVVPISSNKVKDELIENSYEITQYNYIVNGPRKRSMVDLISGYDPFYSDLDSLYALATQIIILIYDEQKNKYGEIFFKNDPEHPLYHTKASNISEEEKKAIMKKFGVSTLDQLIQKYDYIREKFFTKYKKLSPENKVRCKCPTTISTIPSLTSYHFQNGIKAENFEFPPSKDDIISIINKRALNISTFTPISPRKLYNEEITTSPEDINEYRELRDYYTRLSKYMTIDEINLLYSNIKASYGRGMREPYPTIHTKNEQEAKSYYAILQDLFCNLIIEKKGLEFKNDEERELEKIKIVETILKEERKFPLRYTNPQPTAPTINEDAARRIALSTQEGEIGNGAPELNNSTGGMKL